VKAVVALGVNTIDVSHASGYIAIRRLDKKMVVVGHQAVSRNPKIPDLSGFLEKTNKKYVVPMTPKYGLTSSPAVHHMIPCTWVLYSQRPGHMEPVSQRFNKSQEQT
jgi:hypothetical protein